jgi:hypothetical protein
VAKSAIAPAAERAADGRGVRRRAPDGTKLDEASEAAPNQPAADAYLPARTIMDGRTRKLDAK